MKRKGLLKGIVFSFSLFVCVFIGMQICFSQEIKFAYVNIFEVINTYEKTKDYDKVLDAKKEEETKKLEIKRTEIEKMQDNLSVLSKEEQAKKRETITKAAREYQQMEREIMVDLKRERDEKMLEIVEDINKEIQKFAESKGYQMVINESALLYADKTLDKTKEIIELVNKKPKK